MDIPRDHKLAFFAQLRRQLGTFELLSVGAFAILSAGAWVWSLALLAAWHSGRFWPALVGVGLLAIVSGAAALIARRRARWRSDVAVARFVRLRDAALGEELLSLTELHAMPRDVESPPLLDLLAGRVSRDLHEHAARAKKVVRYSPALLRVASAAIALALLFGISFSIARQTMLAGFAELRRDPDRRRFLRDVAEPLVSDLRLRLTPPAYSGKPAQELHDTSGTLSVLPGTKIDVSGKLERSGDPLLLFESDPNGTETRIAAEQHPLVITGGRATGNFVVKYAGSYRFVVDRFREANAKNISLQTDAAPKIELRTPGATIESDGQPIELAYQADDDYGIDSVTLVWQADAGAKGTVAVLEKNHGTHASGTFVWEVRELAGKVDGRVTYFFEAKDNDNVLGPNIGRSRTFTLVFHDPNKQTDRAIADLERARDEAVSLLGHHLQPAPPLAHIHDEFEQFLMSLGVAQKAPAAPKKFLGEVIDHLRPLERAERNAVAPKVNNDKAFAKLLPVAVVALEQDVLRLDDYVGKKRMQDMARITEEMAALRDELRKMMEEYRKNPTPELREKIRQKMAELQQKLAELRALSAQLSHDMPDEFVNRDAIEKRSVDDKMKDVDKLLAQGKLDEAMDAFEAMSRSLDQMRDSVNQDLNGFDKARFPEEDKVAAEGEKRLSDLARDESEVRQQTDPLAPKRTTENDQQFDKWKNDVAAMQKRVQSLPEGTMNPDTRKNTTEDLQSLQESLGDRDPQAASMEADELAKGLQKSAQAARDKGPLGRDAKSLDEMSKALKQMASGQPTPPREKMAALQKQQASVRQRAEQLLKDKAGNALPQGAKSRIERAGLRMQQAEEGLQSDNPGFARRRQVQAQNELKEAQREVSQAKQQGESQQARTKIVIPKDDGQAAPEFRKELIEAMKRNQNGTEREAVERYYKELAR